MDYYKAIKEIKSMLGAFGMNWYRIPEHSRQAILDDTYMQLIKHKDTIASQLTDFEQYKGIMFITLKNIYNGYFETKNRHKRSNDNLYMEDNAFEPPTTDDHTPIDMKIYKDALKTLKPKERAIIRWKARGWSQIYIAQVLNTSTSYLSTLVKEIRIKLKKEINNSLNNEYNRTKKA